MKTPRALLVLALLVPASLQAATLTVASASASRGGTVSVPVSFAPQGSRISGMLVNVSYPAGSIMTAEVTAGPAAAGFRVSGGGDDHTSTVALLTEDLDNPRSLGDGVIFTFSFSVSTEPASTTVVLTPSVPQAFEITGMTVTVTPVAGTVTIGGCVAPAAPLFSTSAATLKAGQSFAASWSGVAVGTGGAYRLEIARSPDFSALVSSQDTSTNSAVISTDVAPQDSTLYARVRGVLGPGCDTPGPFSQALTLTVKGVGASFVLVGTTPFPIATPAGAGNASATFRNVGAQPGRLRFTGDSFFDVSATGVDIAPGSDGVVTLLPKASALTVTGPHRGTLLAVAGTQTISVPFTLTVATGSTETGSRAGTTLRASTSTVTFFALPGVDPTPQQIALTLESVSGPGPVFLAPLVGPGGGWLRLGNELDTPLDNAGRVVTLTLSVDRSKETASEGVFPFRTLLQVSPVGGAPEDAVIIEVLDATPPSISPGAGRTGRAEPLVPPAGTSFILPTTAKAPGQFDAEFFTDGWLRNVGSEDMPADLFYTPQDENGLFGQVLKSSITVPASSTLRLSDLLGAVFQTQGTGQVEVRSASPSTFTLRSTVESVTRGDPTLRFGTEIPTVAFGAGVGQGQGDLAVAGISEDESNRSNLILAETTGHEAQVLLSAYDENGQLLGTLTVSVPPYGKKQFSNVAQRFLDADETLTGGSLALSVTGGSGKVVAIVTVIDNRSNSFSAVHAVKPRAGGSLPGRAPQATGPLTAILPAAVRTVGANNTQFTTNLYLANGTGLPASLTLTYNYVDQDDGNLRKTISKSFVLPPRGALPDAIGTDVLQQLLQLQGRTFGWMKLEGDVARVVGYTAVAAAVDPDDPEKGVKTSAVPAFFSDSREVMVSGEGEHRFTGAEKSVGKRSNMVLVETSGAASDVRIRVYSAGGERLAEHTYSLSPNEYLQINDLFGPGGVELGSGPFQNVEVTAQVVSGSGRVLADVSVIDNLSRNPAIYVLGEPGPPSLGF